MTRAPNILLVDDELSVLRYTKTLLEIENYNVETAASGEEALQRMNQGPAPSLIVLDLVMPGMDGLQTLENCKKMRPDQKVVMISCVNDPNKVVQAMQLGASDYVTKPFLPPQLQVAIRRALGPAAQPKALPTGMVRGNEVVDTLGDDAFFLAVGDQVGLIVKKGSGAFKVAVYAKLSVDQKEAMEKALAAQIVSQL